MYRDYYENILVSLIARFKKDIIGAFKKLQDNAYVELVTSAATHGYLPLFERDSTIFGQLKTGVDAYRRHFGKQPDAIWLPECAYRPGYYHSRGGNHTSSRDWRVSLPKWILSSFLLKLIL